MPRISDLVINILTNRDETLYLGKVKKYMKIYSAYSPKTLKIYKITACLIQFSTKIYEQILKCLFVMPRECEMVK
jgi:hypothetical protein